VFGHYQFNPDAEHSEEWCSMIIETAFNLMFLMNIMNETRPVDKEAKSSSKDKIANNKNIIQDNIVG